MEQDIGFCTVGDRRVAYATVGHGPALVLPAWWFSHLEHDWLHDGFRSFVCALAEHHTVIRYDRLGTGLSDRSPWLGVPTLDMEVETLEAVVAQTQTTELSLFNMSCGACIGARFARRHPERIRRLVFFGAYADGSQITTPEVESAMVATVQAHWGLGARVLTDVFLPEADARERRHFEQAQRRSASSEVAADLLEFVYRVEARQDLQALTAPALVLHRRGDRAVGFELGRRLAGLVPGARFVPLEGSLHVPWLGHSRPVLEATIGFLRRDGDREARPGALRHPNGARVLTAREREVLRLVAAGLADEQIAHTLVVSPHTVHRHVANIRTKLRQPTRTAAAVEAARRQLI